MTIKELYQLFANEDKTGQQVVKLLEQTHWFTINAEFDPRSGVALPQSLSSFLERIANHPKFADFHDRVWRIADHARDSLRHLYSFLNENPSREQALMPIRDVRELDANSFIKLNNRPGRNIREKLAGKPYLQAVRHFQSVDLPENRLLKEFSIQLAELLEMKARNLGTQEDALVQIIRNWLHSDEANSISRWDNTPPNNTLLSHRDYRRVWDAWRWMQALDEDIQNDLAHLEERQNTMNFWNDLECIGNSQNTFIAEIPLLFNYEDFKIIPFAGNMIQVLTDKPFAVSTIDDLVKINAHGKKNKRKNIIINEPSCIDITDVNPFFAYNNKTCQLNVNLICQYWAMEDDVVSIELFYSNAIWLNDNATTIKTTDLFSQSNINHVYLENAARSFTAEIRKHFLNDSLIWLIPDSSNDFELEILRRNLNFFFPYAEPLPRSIAAVIEKVNYSSIPHDGYKVAVLDSINGKSTVTILSAKYSDELKIRVPETNGYCWERHSTTMLNSDNCGANDCFSSIASLYPNGTWKQPYKKKTNSISDKDLHDVPELDNYDICISITNSPVLGGLKAHSFQMIANDIPIWRDYLPDLAMILSANGIFPLVNNMSISPLRGEKIQLDIPKKFILNAGKTYYQFPLIKGNGNDEFHYTAYLHSKDFPLQEDTICSLIMTYEYGANDPYQLRFVSENLINSKRLNILAEWRLFEQDLVDPITLPAPELPLPRTWHELQSYTGKDGNPFNILEDFVNKIHFNQIIEKYNDARTFDTSKIELQKTKLSFCWWSPSYDDNYFFWAEDAESNMVYCSSDHVEDESFDIHNLSKGDLIYANLKRYQPRDTLSITNVNRDKNGNLFCFASTDDGKIVFCHSSHFIERILPSKMKIGTKIYANIKPDKKNPNHFVANMITMQYGNDYAFASSITLDKYSEREKKIIEDKAKNERERKFVEWYSQLLNIRSMILGLRYDYLTIWNSGRTIDQNTNIPSNIRDSILSEIKSAFMLYKFLNISQVREKIFQLSKSDYLKNKQSINVDVVRSRIFDFLSALNGNTPEEIRQELFEIFEDSRKFIFNNRAVAFAIETACMPWQKELFNHFLLFHPNDKKLISVKLEDLSIILWRSLDILDTIPYDSILIILKDLSMILHSEIEELKQNPNDEYIPQRLGRHLDLLLALFRLRRSPDEKARKLLLPLNKYSLNFMNLLTQILQLKIPILSHSITLKIEKDSTSESLPDIIYALQLYLSGDNGANSIQIVSNEDNE